MSEPQLQKVVSFNVGDKVLGIDLNFVQEFVEKLDCTELPRKLKYIISKEIGFMIGHAVNDLLTNGTIHRGLLAKLLEIFKAVISYYRSQLSG